jgi:hypothetical protein
MKLKLYKRKHLLIDALNDDELHSIIEEGKIIDLLFD